jgi:hypothetical protein
MVARIWRTGVKPERFKEYEQFARDAPCQCSASSVDSSGAVNARKSRPGGRTHPLGL